MALSPDQTRALLRGKGWTNATLAAHWGLSLTYITMLVNKPNDRQRVYEDAFQGLPRRDQVVVMLEPRHRRKRKPKPTKWSMEQMYPPRRVFIATDSTLGPEEGTEMAVISGAGDSDDYVVTFELLTGDAAGDEIELRHGRETDSLHDTGQDLRERRAQFA
jgi:hypothetical protein